MTWFMGAVLLVLGFIGALLALALLNHLSMDTGLPHGIPGRVRLKVLEDEMARRVLAQGNVSDLTPKYLMGCAYWGAIDDGCDRKAALKAARLALDLIDLKLEVTNG